MRAVGNRPPEGSSVKKKNKQKQTNKQKLGNVTENSVQKKNNTRVFEKKTDEDESNEGETKK